MFGHTSVGGVTQLPLASFVIPDGTDVWTPVMFGHTSVGGGEHEAVPPLRALIRRPWAL